MGGEWPGIRTRRLARAVNCSCTAQRHFSDCAACEIEERKWILPFERRILDGLRRDFHLQEIAVVGVGQHGAGIAVEVDAKD
jgi:hypothetical protein